MFGVQINLLPLHKVQNIFTNIFIRKILIDVYSVTTSYLSGSLIWQFRMDKIAIHLN